MRRLISTFIVRFLQNRFLKTRFKKIREKTEKSNMLSTKLGPNTDVPKLNPLLADIDQPIMYVRFFKKQNKKKTRCHSFFI